MQFFKKHIIFNKYVFHLLKRGLKTTTLCKFLLNTLGNVLLERTIGSLDIEGLNLVIRKVGCEGTNCQVLSLDCVTKRKRKLV